MSTNADRIIIRAAAESMAGNARGNNEDNVYFNGDFITPRIIRQDFAVKSGEYLDINCFAVFDGMGRGNTGSFASLLAATRMDSLADSISFDNGKDTDEKVLSYVRTANAEIRDQINETGNVRTACTMALLIIENGIAHAYNAGDSRIYLFRDNHLTRLTRDHLEQGKRRVATPLSEVADRSESGLTKYLGMSQAEGTLEPYRCKPFPVKAGDRFLVCSDGVTDFITDDDIASVLLKNHDPFTLADEIVNLALREESDDNLSAIVVEVTTPGLHITQNMKLTFAACMVLLVGMLAGGLLGYIIGAGSVDVSSNFVDVSIYEDIDSYNDYLTSQGITLPGKQPVSGSDVSGSDISNSDIGKDPAGTSTNDGSTSSTKYPTTTYPTTTTAPYVVDYFNLDSSDLTLYIGQTHEFGVEISPADTPREIIEWSSSNEEVATVDENGVVTAISRGNATITAKIRGLTESDTLVETCIVRVKKKR